jgi:hypothetical protein
MSHSKAKIVLAIIIVIILGLVYFFYPKLKPLFGVKPYQTITSEESGTGATIDLYKDVPPSFPKEIFVEKFTLENANTVVGADGRTHITLSYISPNPVASSTDLYVASLSKNNWTNIRPVPLTNLATITAKKGSESIILTITRARFTDSKITFQYEK